MMKNLPSRFSDQIFIAALVVGAALRWYQIGKHSLWYDETFSGLTARLDLWQILSNAAIDIHPPGYYVLLHYWIKLGQSEAILRSFSAIFGVAAIILIYFVAQNLFDKATGALAALFLAIMPFQVYFAQEARMYSLVIFLSIALMWLFVRAVTLNKGMIWIGYILVAVIGLYVHYYTALLLLSLHLWYLVNYSRYREQLFRLLVAGGVTVFLFLPQLNQAFLRARYYLEIEAWQAAPNPLSPLTTIYYLFFAHRAPIWVAPFGLFLTLAALVLILWEGRRIKSEYKVDLLLWLIVFMPIIIVVLVSWVSARSIYVERSFAIISPALILLLARGFLSAPRQSPTPYIILALFLPVIITLRANIVEPDPAKPPVREAANIIKNNFEAGDVSLHLQDASEIPALWYTPDIPHTLIDVLGAAFIFDSTHRLFGGDVVEWQSALTGADRLWLTTMPGFNNPQQIAILKKIDSTYPRLMLKDWGAVQLYLYDIRDSNE